MSHVERRTQLRRNGKTAVAWRARYRDLDGRERSRTFGTKVDAQRFLASVEHAKLRGEWVDPALGKTSCGTYLDSWLATKAAVAKSTKQNIEGRIAKHIRPFFGDMALGSVRPEHARAFVAQLVNAGYAPSTIKSITLTAAQVFRQAVDDGLIVRSPFARVELPRERQREEMHFLTSAQVNELAQAIDNRYSAAIYLAAYGGLRAGELWALTVERTNLLAARIDITVSMSEAGGLHVGPTKTGKRRTITIPRFLAQMLGEHIGRYPSANGWVFTSPEGGPVHHHNFRHGSSNRRSKERNSRCGSTTFATRARRCSSPRAGTSRK